MGALWSIAASRRTQARISVPGTSTAWSSTQTLQRSRLSAADLFPAGVGRPHLVYSAANHDYVLWVNANSPGYPVFTSKILTHGFVLDSNRALVGYQPPGSYQAGDFSVQVIDNQGYLVHSLLDFTTTGASIWPPFNQSLYVQKLTPDMRNTTGPAFHVLSNNDLVDFEAESPDIFKRGEYFCITASNTLWLLYWHPPHRVSIKDTGWALEATHN